MTATCFTFITSTILLRHTIVLLSICWYLFQAVRPPIQHDPPRHSFHLQSGRTTHMSATRRSSCSSHLLPRSLGTTLIPTPCMRSSGGVPIGTRPMMGLRTCIGLTSSAPLDVSQGGSWSGSTPRHITTLSLGARMHLSRVYMVITL